MEVSRDRNESAVIIFDPAADTSIDLNVPDVTDLLGWGDTASHLVIRNGARVEKKSVVELQASPAR